MERLVVPVSAMVADALRQLAWREDRDPKRQAERFIREGLIREGALPDLAHGIDQARADAGGEEVTIIVRPTPEILAALAEGLPPEEDED